MIIALLGYMGVGKSSIGAQLASDLGYDFVDLDTYIEQKEKLSISELFKKRGEIYFRKKEHQYLKELYSFNSNIILSLGGGTPCYYGNIDIINTQTSIYLKLLPINLAKRLFYEKKKRPLIASIDSIKDMLEYVSKHLFERFPFYNQAHYKINVNEKSISEISKEIIEKINL